MESEISIFIFTFFNCLCLHLNDKINYNPFEVDLYIHLGGLTVNTRNRYV